MHRPPCRRGRRVRGSRRDHRPGAEGGLPLTASAERIPCAVLGAPGYIGQHFTRLLWDHPWFAEPVLVGTPRTAGRALGEFWQLPEWAPPAAARVGVTTPARLAKAGIRVAFSALPSGTAGPLERALARRGVAVFTNAADLRSAPGVPLLVPEVNEPELGRTRRRPARTAPIVANPNCSATGLALGLAPVVRALAPESVHVATYQALSGAGFPGVPSLASTDNVVPFISGEEEKIQAETSRLLEGRFARLRVIANAARVAVRDGHLEAVTITSTRRPSTAELVRAWREFRPLAKLRLPTAPEDPVIVRAEEDRPQPIRDRWAGSPSRAAGMSATIGRVRWDPPFLRFFVLSHNAVRGGAGGSVLNAELAVARGVVGEGAQPARAR